MANSSSSSRLTLFVVAAIQLAGGVMLTFFNHELFKFLEIPRPALLLPFQVWGAIGIAFGVGLFSVASRASKHRPLLRLLAMCKLSAGAAVLVATMVQGLNASYAMAACLFELAPAAALGGVLWQLSSLAASSPAPHFRRRLTASLAPFAPIAALLVLALGIVAPALLETGRNRGWLAPDAAMRVRFVDASKAHLKDAPWARLPSNFPLAPGSGFDYRLTPALGGCEFIDPVSMQEMPDGSGRFLVAERTGRLVTVDIRNGRKSTVLDLRPIVHYGAYSPEEGLLSVALHPGFSDPRSVGYQTLFLYYTRLWESKTSNCLASYKFAADGQSIDAASEKMLFCQAYQFPVHHGGGLAFGLDGFLYVGVGDGWWGAPNPNAQNISGGFFSGILRIDVDQRRGEISHPIRRPPQNGFSAGYFVPNDNPFLAENGENLEEFFAIGFRNPWRISFDRQSGQLWVADSGFERREEINRVSKGDNGGWAYLEGSVPTQSFHKDHLPKPEKLLGREIAPTHEYPRSVSFCTIGGFIYRGQELPDLRGQFIFGDASGQVFALKLDERGVCQKKTQIATVPQPLQALCSLAEDADGEIYFLAMQEIGKETGAVYKLARGPVAETAKIPQKLSETGLFADLKSLTPHSALAAYEVNVPFWSDHAIKSRFVGSQSGLPIRGVPGLPFQIPPGTIFAKHFDFALDERHPEQLRRLETRLLVFTLDRGWYGLCYRWNAEGTDAELIDDAQTETLVVTEADGSTREQLWSYPDRHSCLACHNGATEGAVGFSYRQLWKKEGERNQLESLRDRGILAAETLACNLNHLQPLTSMHDESQSLEARARSYLDANCAYCHVSGVGYAAFSLRVDTPLDKSQLLSEPLFKHFSDHSGGQPVTQFNPAMAIRPGNPDDSFLLRRIETVEEGRRMPPLGRATTDRAGAKLVRDWISSMKQNHPAATHNLATPAGKINSQEPLRK